MKKIQRWLIHDMGDDGYDTIEADIKEYRADWCRSEDVAKLENKYEKALLLLGLEGVGLGKEFMVKKTTQALIDLLNAEPETESELEFQRDVREALKCLLDQTVFALKQGLGKIKDE